MKKFFWILVCLRLPAFGQDAGKLLPVQVWNLTQVMYHDVVNPPAAARFYAYSMLAGYEIYSKLNPGAISLKNLLKEYPIVATSESLPVSIPEFAVLYGILETGKQIIPSGQSLQDKQEELIDLYKKKGTNAEAINEAIEFTKKISAEIVRYSRTDGYFKLSTRNRYKPFSNDGSWKPTPPEYMAPVEPHWRTIRTFFLDSAQQFKPALPVNYDSSKGSLFMKMVNEVYHTVSHLNEEEMSIANFWDCNPFAVQFQGHMSIGLKKISPGGHWMGITGIACQQAGLDFGKSLFLHTLVALTLHDAFLSCWDEKFRSNRVRPETVINRKLDAGWKPYLQSPPFPEYSSGHSVISTAAAEILTHFLGNNFSFTDSTETYIGLPPRNFSSFRKAAAEARISRLYGGIHFRDAIENGGEQGRKIGEFIINRLTTLSMKN